MTTNPLRLLCKWFGHRWGTLQSQGLTNGEPGFIKCHRCGTDATYVGTR